MQTTYYNGQNIYVNNNKKNNDKMEIIKSK